MRADDKLLLIRFITRTSMFINPVNRDTIVSFVHGYEAGKNSQNFTSLAKRLLTEKYIIYSSSDGWPGQIGRYARNCSWGWVAAFKHIGMEIIMADGIVEAATQHEIRRWVVSRFEWAGRHPNVWLKKEWREDWLAICAVRAEWFAAIWSAEEWKLLVIINEQLRTIGISERLLQFKLAKLGTEFRTLERVREFNRTSC